MPTRRDGSDNPTGDQRITAHFSGDVQGVGFRYTTMHVAGRYRVTGYVRNLRDGRVELVAEGPAAELGRFLNDVEQAMAGYISDTQLERSAATGEFGSFSVAR